MRSPDRPGVSVGVFISHFVPAYRAGGHIRSVSAITAPRDSDTTYAVFATGTRVTRSRSQWRDRGRWSSIGGEA